jgi:hypothetical protein
MLSDWGYSLADFGSFPDDETDNPDLREHKGICPRCRARSSAGLCGTCMEEAESPVEDF